MRRATLLHHLNPYAQTQHVDTFHCSASEPNPIPNTIQVQADGEHLGHTPMTVTLIPNALRLLMP
jgi:diacylglycerol kinase family enzyme